MAVTAIDTPGQPTPDPSACWCCNRGPDKVPGFVRLGCHPEVAICYSCLDWLENARREKVRAMRHWGRLSIWQRIRRIYPGNRC